MKLRMTIVICLVTLAVAASVTAGNGTMMVSVDAPSNPWGDPQVKDKLETLISRNDAYKLSESTGNMQYLPAFPAARRNTDSLLNYAQEAGVRYLVVVTIDSERLTKRKGFSLPLIFHKWEAVGVIEGELRLIDAARGKLLTAEPFKVEMKGPRIFQASMDANKNDPSLHISAVEKLTFFSRLEDKLAETLVKRIGLAIRKR